MDFIDWSSYIVIHWRLHIIETFKTLNLNHLAEADILILMPGYQPYLFISAVLPELLLILTSIKYGSKLTHLTLVKLSC